MQIQTSQPVLPPIQPQRGSSQLSSRSESHNPQDRFESEVETTEPSSQALISKPKRLGKFRWTLTGMLTGLAVGTAMGAALTPGSLAPAIVAGAGAGALVGGGADLWSVPDKLFHFTGTEAAAAIKESGFIEARPGNHGDGVYLTRFPSRTVAALQRAKLTDSVYRVSTEGHTVKRTIIPGTFLIEENIELKPGSVAHSESDESKLADWIHNSNFRERWNPLAKR